MELQMRSSRNLSGSLTRSGRSLYWKPEAYRTRNWLLASISREFSTYMSLIEELLEGRFQLPCSEIRLTREKGDPIEIAGPGAIGLHAKGKFEYSIKVSAADHALIYDFGLRSLRPPGSLFPPESYFRLKATSSSEGVWSGQALLPQAVSGEETLRGTLSELISEQGEAPAEFDRATMFVPTKLSFPTFHPTRRDGGISYDHTEFPIDSESFTFYHRNSFTELDCRLEPGSISKNRHRRLQEALGFALCQPVWPSAVILRSGGRRSDILYSPSKLATNYEVSFAPFHFANQPPDSRAKFFDIVSAYYRKIIHDESLQEHPISSGVALIMVALQSYVNVMVLALAVAAEALIRIAFPDIVAIDPGLKGEIKKFKALVNESDLSESFKNRIKGSADGYTSRSAQDRLYSFITKFALDPKIHDVWKKARNPVVHGTLIDLLTDDAATILEKRNKVLYLCYAIVLGYIGYSGPHTRYDVLGYPVRDWTPPV
jgi:hypothetical protein